MRPSGSLRLKLTVWYLVVFVLIQVGLLALMVRVRRESLTQSFEDRLARSAEVTANNLAINQPEWDDQRVAALLPADALFGLFAVRDPSGAVLAKTPGRRVEGLPFGDPERGPLASTTRIPAERGLELIGRRVPVHLVTLPFATERESELYLQVAAAADDPERSFGPFLDLFRIGVPVGLIAALVASWLIGGRAVSPFRRFSEAARGVDPERLSQALDVGSADREVSRLQDDLNQALRRIEETYRAHYLFISHASHELRTPVSVLLAEAQVLAAGSPSFDDYSRYVRSVEEEMKRLTRLVETFLELSRADLEHGLGPALEEVSLHDVVLDSLRHTAHLARRRDLRLVPRFEAAQDSRGEPLVVGDATLLRSVAENLLRNAVRFSPEGSRILVGVRVEGAEAVLEVCDSGPGIPPEHRERIFLPFEQGPQPAPQEGRAAGTGLGLAIAQRVVKLHRGRIAVEDNPAGPGCTVTVRLPRAR